MRGGCGDLEGFFSNLHHSSTTIKASTDTPCTPHGGQLSTQPALGHCAIPSPSRLCLLPSKQENGEINLFSASALRERAGDAASQLLASRGREGSFEVRYQQPFEDFRVSQEQLADHFESRERR